MRRLIGALFTATVASACTSIDCPVDNVVATNYRLLKADGSNDTLQSDTLTISTKQYDGSDTVLLNRSLNTTAFSLPMSSGARADTLYLFLQDTTGTRLNIIYVEKTDVPHFESVDCSMSYFHTITNITWQGTDIDSIVTNKNLVDYDTSTPNIYIYFNSSN